MLFAIYHTTKGDKNKQPQEEQLSFWDIFLQAEAGRAEDLSAQGCRLWGQKQKKLKKKSNQKELRIWF